MTIRDIFLGYTELVEPLSLDEAYLDVTENKRGMVSATLIARELKGKIRETVGLTASAGVSFNKFLAKVASDYKKPDGLFVITPEDAEHFVEDLDIGQFWGIGRVTEARMRELGINKGRDLKKWSEAELTRRFGKAGHIYYLNARGIDEREVTSDRVRKSLGAENTFLRDLSERGEIMAGLREIADEVWERITRHGFYGRTMTLKVKYSDFSEISKRRTFHDPVESFRFFWSAAKNLMESVDFGYKKEIRLIGLTVSNVSDNDGYRQLLLDFGEDDFP